jgi:hypothetical protein
VSIRITGVLLPLALAAAPALAQMPGQSFEVQTDSGAVTVGDPVTLRLRLRLDDRDLLFDTIPVPAISRLRGARVLSVSRMVRDKDRIYLGQAQVAFYRPGHQPAPTFSVTFMRAVKGVQRGVLVSDTAWVDVTPVLPAGDHPLKDLRPLEESPAPRWPWLALAVAAGMAVWLLRRRPRRPVRAAMATSRLSEDGGDAREQALDRLHAIEREQWPARGEVARHYEAVADVVRDFLARVEQAPARTLTSAELLRALAHRHRPQPDLDRCRHLLAEADLVKFAALRPGAGPSVELLASARELLVQWPVQRNGARDATG